MIDFLEKENCISKKFENIIDKEILSNNFSWFYEDYSTSSKDYNISFFCHTLKSRHNNIINSNYFHMFEDILNSFCEINDIQYTKIYRAALNLSLHFNFKHSQAHTDHNFNHKVFIMYLNDFNNGSTILFKKEQDKYIEYKTFLPKKNKIIYFDGKYEHAIQSCNENERRVVCVITTD